jgi:hypothetical protein
LLLIATCHPSAILVLLCEEQICSLTGSIFGLYDCIEPNKFL